jgi:hypothetical protein
MFNYVVKSVLITRQTIDTIKARHGREKNKV